MLLGDEERVIGPRSIVYVPRGVPHSMRNGASTPLYGYAVFTPAFDGKDRVAVEP
jgi:mannose-6-phosphate isomerase-like protein (cupin superfamily)